MHHAECVMFNLDNHFCTFGLELGQKGCLIIAIFNISHNCPSSLCSTVQRGGVIFEKKIDTRPFVPNCFPTPIPKYLFLQLLFPTQQPDSSLIQEEAMSYLFILNFRLKRTDVLPTIWWRTKIFRKNGIADFLRQVFFALEGNFPSMPFF